MQSTNWQHIYKSEVISISSYFAFSEIFVFKYMLEEFLNSNAVFGKVDTFPVCAIVVSFRFHI